MANFGTLWLMSMIWASRAIERMTPRQIAGADSGPKSVRKLMTGRSMAADGTEAPGIGSSDRRAPGPESEAAPGGGGRRFGLGCRSAEEGGRPAKVVGDRQALARPAV